MGFMVLVALNYLLGRQPIQSSARVTYSTKASRATIVLKDLSRLSRLNLEASPETAGEILIVAVKNEPISDILPRIATVTSSEWKQEGNKLRLVPSLSRRKLERQEEISTRAKNIQQAIHWQLLPIASRDLAKDKEKGGHGEPTLEQITISKLLATVSLAELAHIGDGDRVVYATEPTTAQRPLTGQARTVANEFIRLHNLAIELFNHADASYRLQHRHDNIGTKIGTYSKVMLIVARSGSASMAKTRTEFRLYDFEGKVVFATDSPLNDEVGFTYLTLGPTDKPISPNLRPTSGPKIVFSSDSLELLSSTRFPKAGKTSPGLREGLYRKLLHPDSFDPLSYLISDELLSYAAARRQPLIADVPDLATGDIWLGEYRPITVESIRSSLKSGREMMSIPDKGFILIKPFNSEASRRTRMDRLALRNLMAAIETKCEPSTDDLAKYAARQPNPTDGGIGQFLFCSVVPFGVEEELTDDNHWNMLRFLSALTPLDRGRLALGDQITLRQLTEIQRNFLMPLVYNAEVAFCLGSTKPGSHLRYQTVASIGDDLQLEPTELAPNGLPRDSYLTLRQTTEPIVSNVPTSGLAPSTLWEAFGPAELARRRQQRVEKGLPTDFRPRELTGLRLGKRTIMEFVFHLSPRVSFSHILAEDHLPQGGPVYSEGKLPKDLEKLVMQRLATLPH